MRLPDTNWDVMVPMHRYIHAGLLDLLMGFGAGCWRSAARAVGDGGSSRYRLTALYSTQQRKSTFSHLHSKIEFL